MKVTVCSIPKLKNYAWWLRPLMAIYRRVASPYFPEFIDMVMETRTKRVALSTLPRVGDCVTFTIREPFHAQFRSFRCEVPVATKLVLDLGQDQLEPLEEHRLVLEKTSRMLGYINKVFSEDSCEVVFEEQDGSKIYQDALNELVMLPHKRKPQL